MLMSFFYTLGPFRDRSKTVTRRPGWLFLKAGDVLTGVVKAQGLKRGETVERLHDIRILSVRREPLNAITAADVRREGFPGMSPAEFVRMYCGHMGGAADQIITRVEFEHI